MEQSFLKQERERMSDQFTKGVFVGVGFVMFILILGQLIK
jgi:hypothetical protein